jgi:hypothetical protein
MTRTPLRRAAALLCCILAFTATGWAQTVEPLFFIARTKNANKVYYEARLTADGTLDVKQPIHAYWILWAKDTTGKTREELSGMEKRMAFGFTVSKASPTSCTVSLAAFRSRPIEVTVKGTTCRAVTTIAGKPAYLKNLFVVSGGGVLIPHVSSVTLYGSDAATGASVQEVITPR